MTKTTKIAFPSANRPIRWANEPASFISFGQSSPGVLSVDGELLLDTSPVGSATTLQRPTAQNPFWLILFKNVPFTKAGQSYALEIRENGTLLARREGLKVEGVHGIGVAYPLANDTVCSSFASYGSTDESGDVSAKLVKGSSETYGTPLQNGPVWVVMFTGVTADTYDKLVAQVNQSNDGSSTNITVDNLACTDVPPPPPPIPR